MRDFPSVRNDGKNQSRREFLACAGMAAASLAGCATRREVPQWTGKEKVKAVLLHLGHNYFSDWLPDDLMHTISDWHMPDLKLRNNDELWRRTTARMAERGLNMAVIDICEALVYPSHPELAVEGSWSPDRLRDEVLRLRGMGIEAIPKLNFSATHDGWLKHYHRMLTLPKYYEVVKDVIRDVAEIFGTPRFFHLGFDEERAEPGYIKDRGYFVMRAGETWWHDFLYTVKCAEDCGCRAWVWSDKGWGNPEYVKRCPKSVVQSNWYYDECYGGFDLATNKTQDHKRLKEFWELEEAGFDQIPCGTNSPGWNRRNKKIGADDVLGKLVKLGREVVSDEHLLGFMVASWRPCDNERHARWVMRGVDLLADACEGKIASVAPLDPEGQW